MQFIEHVIVGKFCSDFLAYMFLFIVWQVQLIKNLICIAQHIPSLHFWGISLYLNIICTCNILLLCWKTEFRDV